MDDMYYMRKAIEEAKRSIEHQDIPIGALIVYKNEVIASRHNEVELQQDVCAHAEILTIKDAAKVIGYKFLLDCSLYVTLEPCTMCAGAIVLARIPNLIYAASDPKTGACKSLYSITQDQRLNHRCNVVSGILEKESSVLVREFFKNIRGIGNRESVVGSR